MPATCSQWPPRGGTQWPDHLVVSSSRLLVYLSSRHRLQRLRRLPLALALGIAVGCGKPDAAPVGTIPGVTGDTITVGALVPLSDNVAIVGKPVVGGVVAYFQQLNDDRGGIGGRYKVRVLTEDVTYNNPSTTVQKYNKLRDQVAMFVPILGTDHVNVALPLLAEDNLLAVPSTFDAEWVREPHLVPAFAPYQLQMINAAAYYLDQAGGRGKTICAFVMSSGYGQAAEEGVTYAAHEMGFTVASTARMRPGDQDFVAQITQLRNAKCEAVFFASLPSETSKIFAAAAQLGFEPRWIATSPTWHPALGKSAIADYAKRHLWSSAEGGEWGDTSVAGMAALLRAHDRYAPGQSADLYFAAGYAFGRAAAAVLEKAVALGDLSREGLAKALVSLDTVSFGGLAGTYRYGPAASREPPRLNTIFSVDPSHVGGYSTVARNVGSAAATRFEFKLRRP